MDLPAIMLQPPTGPKYTYRAKVRSVYDGDSLRVDVDLGFGHVWQGEDGKGVALRLYGVDTPELRGPERPEGLAVRDKVMIACPVGADVILRTVRDRTGKFGRYLAVIWTPHLPVSLNAWLLQEGMAEPFMI